MRSSKCTFAALSLLAFSAGAHAQNSFTVTRLGFLPGDDPFPSSVGFGINHLGQAVGASSSINHISLGGELHAFLWDPVAGMQLAFADLYPQETHSSAARDINDSGALLGSGSTLNGGSSAQFLFVGGAYVPYQTPAGYSRIFAARLNNPGQTIGQSLQSPATWAATLWGPDGTPTLLNAPGQGSFGRDVNDSGVAVGEGNVAPGAAVPPNIPWVWDNVHGAQTLPFLGVGGGAMAINNNGVIGGYVELLTRHRQDHAAIWENGAVRDIHQFGNGSAILDLNDAGQAVGTVQLTSAESPPPFALHGFYYADGAMRRLVLLVAESVPFVEIIPRAINSAGQIIAEGRVKASDSFPREALLLTPSDVLLPVPTDATASLRFQLRKAAYDPATKTWRRSAVLTNVGATPIAGPLKLVLGGGASASSTPASGTLAGNAPLNASYWTVSAGPGERLLPGRAATISLSFTLATLRFSEYSLIAVFAGPGRP